MDDVVSDTVSKLDTEMLMLNFGFVLKQRESQHKTPRLYIMLVSSSSRLLWIASLSVFIAHNTYALIPLIDGGKQLPVLYQGWMNEQIAKQASTAIGKAVGDGIRKMEVCFPPVPNVEEVKFGTTLNQKFGSTVVAKDIGFKGGYKPGSDISRQLIAYSNIYWAKKIAPAVGGGVMGNNRVTVLTAEPVNFKLVSSTGVGRTGLLSPTASNGFQNSAVILVNPGGEEQWERLRSVHGGSDRDPFVVLNNAYSTTYDLGNKRDYEEVYYCKRISRGWVFRAYPGNWLAYLEKPDGGVELLAEYEYKPSLKEVATEVREESFRRYAMGNDRWMSGRL